MPVLVALIAVEPKIPLWTNVKLVPPVATILPLIFPLLVTSVSGMPVIVTPPFNWPDMFTVTDGPGGGGMKTPPSVLPEQVTVLPSMMQSARAGALLNHSSAIDATD